MDLALKTIIIEQLGGTPIPDAKHSCQELVHFHLRFTHKYQGDLSTISSGPGLQSFLKVKDSSTVMEVILSINKYFSNRFVFS